MEEYVSAHKDLEWFIKYVQGDIPLFESSVMQSKNLWFSSTKLDFPFKIIGGECDPFIHLQNLFAWRNCVEIGPSPSFESLSVKVIANGDHSIVEPKNLNADKFWVYVTNQLKKYIRVFLCMSSNSSCTLYTIIT